MGLPEGCVIRYAHIPTHATREGASGLGAGWVKDADPCLISTACGPACRSVVLLVPHECAAPLGRWGRDSAPGWHWKSSSAACSAFSSGQGDSCGRAVGRCPPAHACCPALPCPALPCEPCYLCLPLGSSSGSRARTFTNTRTMTSTLCTGRQAQISCLRRGRDAAGDDCSIACQK